MMAIGGLNRSRIGAALSVSFLATVLSVSAVDLYWDGAPGAANGLSDGGDGTWSTAAANWDTGSGYTVWNGTNNTAVFGAGNGTVTLSENIYLKHLVFGHGAGNTNDNGSWEYTIQDNTLRFGAGGTITNRNGEATGSQTISSGITGEPNVSLLRSTSTDESIWTGLTFAPANGVTQALGTATIAVPSINTGRPCLVLGGTSTGNTIQSIVEGSAWQRMYITDACDWTLLGNCTISMGQMDGGDFKVNGTLSMNSGVGREFLISGGTMHLNNEGALRTPSTAKNWFHFKGIGAQLDNSSGAAITNSTYNPQIKVTRYLNFIGSQGTNSDLNFGTGAVVLQSTSFVTVSNDQTTFTIGGIISGAGDRGMLKGGAGTLRLTGANTFAGETVVEDGTLSLGVNGAIADGSSLRIETSGKVNIDAGVNVSVASLFLDGVLQTAGEWGSATSTATYTDDTYFTGTGVVTALTGAGDYDVLMRDDFESGLGNWTPTSGVSLVTLPLSQWSEEMWHSGTNCVQMLDPSSTETKFITLTEPLSLAKKRYTNLRVTCNIRWWHGSDPLSESKLIMKYAADGDDFTPVATNASTDGVMTFNLPVGAHTFTDTAKIQLVPIGGIAWADAYIDDVMIIASPAYTPSGTVFIVR